MEAGVGRKSVDDDDDDGEVDKEIECAGVLDTPPATLLPARAASQGEGGLGLTRGSIFFCENEKEEEHVESSSARSLCSLVSLATAIVLFSSLFFLSLKILAYSIYALQRGLSPQLSDRKHSSKGNKLRQQL